jgi:hypothetical protein
MIDGIEYAYGIEGTTQPNYGLSSPHIAIKNLYGTLYRTMDCFLVTTYRYFINCLYIYIYIYSEKHELFVYFKISYNKFLN